MFKSKGRRNNFSIWSAGEALGRKNVITQLGAKSEQQAKQTPTAAYQKVGLSTVTKPWRHRKSLTYKEEGQTRQHRFLPKIPAAP